VVRHMNRYLLPADDANAGTATRRVPIESPVGIYRIGNGTYTVVAETAADALTRLSLKHDKPVTLGIAGPGMSAAEARERLDYGARAVESAVEMLDALPDED